MGLYDDYWHPALKADITLRARTSPNVRYLGFKQVETGTMVLGRYRTFGHLDPQGKNKVFWLKDLTTGFWDPKTSSWRYGYSKVG